MHELRWDPIYGRWVVIASSRHDRPVLKSTCPFCPGSPEVRGEWTVKALPNMFPPLTPEAPEVRDDKGLYRRARAEGFCEVIVESKEHSIDLADLTLGNFLELMKLYRDRYVELGGRREVKYVYIFRNKGEIIGVTLHHPHGQLYALPFIPPVIRDQLDGEAKYRAGTGRCMLCDMVKEEIDGPRLVDSNDHFAVYVPFAAKFAYETHIVPLGHVSSLSEMGEPELYDLGKIMKGILSRYNHLFDFSLPYVMALYNSPTDGREYPYHHFHVDIMPRHRSRDNIKYLAGSELGAGVFINDSSPEERAAELRNL